MKNRIIKVTRGNNNFHYEVQYKFLWYWRTYKIIDCSIDGLCEYEPYCFNSLEKAEDFLKEKNKVREIVKYYNYEKRD